MDSLYESAETFFAVTCNLDFSEWGTLFASPYMQQLLDRLLHHTHVITLRGDSYRVPGRLVPPRDVCAGLDAEVKLRDA